MLNITKLAVLIKHYGADKPNSASNVVSRLIYGYNFDRMVVTYVRTPYVQTNSTCDHVLTKILCRCAHKHAHN